MTARPHAVQFYETTAFMHASVRQFFDSALDQGEPCVMIARHSTYKAVVDGLVTSRGGMSDAITAIRFVDAAAALDGFMDGRRPDPSRFEKSLSPLWNDLHAGEGGVTRIHGEMADLLCAADNHAAAIRVEQFGERLVRERQVSILCTHSLEHFGRERDARHLHAICQCHTHVMPAEPIREAPDEWTRGERIVHLQHRSRVFDTLERDRVRTVGDNPLTSPVCVIDDDASIRKSIERMLTLNGLTVQTFASAEQFLAAASGITGGCLIVDVQLLGMSGLELQKEMAGSRRALPVIAMSGSTDTWLEGEAKRLGARAFLRKPFEAEALLSEVRRALRAGATPAG